MDQVQEPMPGDGSRAWNMAQFFYFSLNKLIEEKDEAYIQGNLRGWFRCLKAILRRSSHKITKEELAEIQIKFDRAYNMLSSQLPRHLQNMGDAVIRPEVEKMLDEIDTDLTRLMDKYEMIEPKFLVKGVDTIERRMKL